LSLVSVGPIKFNPKPQQKQIKKAQEVAKQQLQLVEKKSSKPPGHNAALQTSQQDIVFDTNQTAVAIQGSLKANAENLIEEAQKNPTADVDSSAFDFTIGDVSNSTTAAQTVSASASI
jgi:hypothetical protein